MITWTNAPERAPGTSEESERSGVPRQHGRPATDGPPDGTGGQRRPPSDTELLAERIADEVMTCDDVAALTAGPHGRVATYRVGAPLQGVAVRAGLVEVGLVVRPGRPLPPIADDVRGLVRRLCEGRQVDVLIADLAE